MTEMLTSLSFTLGSHPGCLRTAAVLYGFALCMFTVLMSPGRLPKSLSQGKPDLNTDQESTYLCLCVVLTSREERGILLEPYCHQQATETCPETKSKDATRSLLMVDIPKSHDSDT